MIFLNSGRAALVFYLPGVCTHTDPEGKQRKARVRNIFKIFGKNTIFNEHPVESPFYFLSLSFLLFYIIYSNTSEQNIQYFLLPCQCRLSIHCQLTTKRIFSFLLKTFTFSLKAFTNLKCLNCIFDMIIIIITQTENSD